jgi:hypothetical protein
VVPCICGFADARAALAAVPSDRRPDPKPAAEAVMDPILRVWFGTDADGTEVHASIAENQAENAAIDLSWALEAAGLLAPPGPRPEQPTEEER